MTVKLQSILLSNVMPIVVMLNALKMFVIVLSDVKICVVILRVILQWHYTDCFYAWQEMLTVVMQCHYANCHYAECHYAEGCYANCH